MRVLHFSDIHVGVPLGRVPAGKWLSKRALGGLHLAVGRGSRFAAAREKVAALAEFARREKVELVIFTGDYTALGLDEEFRLAREAVTPLMNLGGSYLNVPGNHDLYVAQVVQDRRFEHYFGDTLASDLPASTNGSPWPLVRLPHPDVAVVAVDSARPNPPWLSTGRVPEDQLRGLARTLADARVRDRFVFVATHYAPRLADGGPDRRLHRMDNADAFLSACAGIRRGAILCGHVHHRFHVRVPGVAAGIFCGGSATLAQREGAWLFEVDPLSACAIPVRWQGATYATLPEARVDLPNPV